MVTDYHLLRDAQLRQAETLDRRDEDTVPAVTFKDWLRAYEWDDEPRRPDEAPAGAQVREEADDEWAAAWAAHRPTGVDTRLSTAVEDADPVEMARVAVDAIPAPRAPADDEPAAGWATWSGRTDDATDGATADGARFGIAS